MAEDEEENLPADNEENPEEGSTENNSPEQDEVPADEPEVVGEEDVQDDALTKVTGMYKDWFLDYASYVILERAVPAIEDGFKPVQ